MANGPRRVEPMRSCAVCREPAAKRTLYRLVRSPHGLVRYDPSGKAPGRGAYLCGRPACLEGAGKRRTLQRALRAADASEVAAAIAALGAALAGGAQVGASRMSELEEVRTG